jgi:hypothetical protein
MDGLRQRLMTPRRRVWLALSLVVCGLLATLYAPGAQHSAAHPAAPGDTVTITFTVTVTAGTPPADTIFWLCADAQTDGTGCNEMMAQPDGSFTFQLTTTTGTTYRHITIEWSRGLLPTSNGEIPEPPVQTPCSYSSFTVSMPESITCQADFTMLATTPTFAVSTVSPTAAASATVGSTPGNDDNSTLITGLYVVIGVGLVLFVILLIILIWQRVSARQKLGTRRKVKTQHR